MSKKKSEFYYILLISLLTILVSHKILFGHYHGDDEIVSLIISNQIITSIKNFDYYEFTKIILQNY